MIKNILKGVVIGIANIIPGVSGGTMAVSMGIYDKMIHCVTHLFKEFKKSVQFLLPIFIGAGIGLLGLTFVIQAAFERFPMPTNLLFIGLIVGGLPTVWKKVQGQKISVGHAIAALAFFALVVGMAAIGEAEGRTADMSLGPVQMVKFFGVGMIASATMIIPGVSGSMVLLLLGYYNAILDTITGFLKALVAFDMPAIMHNLGIIIPMGLGIVFGIFAIAKIIEIVFAKFPLYAYWAIIGLIVASPFAIIMMGQGMVISVGNVIASVVTFVAGFLIAMKLGE